MQALKTLEADYMKMADDCGRHLSQRDKPLLADAESFADSGPLRTAIPTRRGIDRNRCPQSIGITVRVRRNPQSFADLVKHCADLEQRANGKAEGA
jgi:hypothetical protein